MSSNRSPRLRGQVAGLLHRPLAGRVRCDATEVHPASAMLDEHQDVQSLVSSTVSTCRKSTATIPEAWVCRNCRQVGPERRGAGSIPAARRISHTVDGATVTPSFVSSPWIRRYPHSGFSFASRTTRLAMLGTVGGRPGLRRLLVSYFSRPVCGARPAASRASRERCRPAPSGYESCQRGEPHPVGRLVTHPAELAAQHRVLVPEDQQLSILRPVAAEHQHSQAEYTARQQVDDLEQHPPSQPSPRPACWQQCSSPPNRVFERHRFRQRHSAGRAYFEKKLAEGKTRKEALRALKRRISDAIYARLQADARRARAKGPAGQQGNDSVASAAGSHPQAPALRPSHSRTRPHTTTPASPPPRQDLPLSPRLPIPPGDEPQVKVLSAPGAKRGRTTLTGGERRPR